MKKPAILALVLFTVLATAATALADLKMGIFPRRNVAATNKAFKPLAQKLSKSLGEQVILVVPKNFATFWEGVEKQEFDLVHFNQFHYVRSHDAFGYKVLVANEEFGKRSIAGALAVRKDSGINSVADLKGKSILFGGGKQAMASYIAPTAILKRQGLTAGSDYREVFAKNPPGAAIGTFNNAADCAGIGNVVLQLPIVTERIEAEKMHVLAQSEEFVHLPWAVKSDVPEAKASAIRQVMVSLKGSAEGEEILKAAKVTGFYPVSDDDFEAVRELIRFAAE